jgi:hypothetical protein
MLDYKRGGLGIELVKLKELFILWFFVLKRLPKITLKHLAVCWRLQIIRFVGVLDTGASQKASKTQ